MNADRNLPWSCRAVRAWHAVASKQAGHGADRVARHVASCADCQRYFSRAAALESSLRAGAPMAAAAPNDDRHARIMRALTDAQRERRARRHTRTPVLVALGAAVAAAMLAAIIQTRDTMAPRRSLPPPAVVAPRDVSPEPASNLAATTAEHWMPAPAAATPDEAPGPLDRLAPVASALARDPLQSEVDSVYADARNAVRFLALNFLPNGALADNGSERRAGSDFRRSGG